jgi:hypothetical protein
MTVSVPAIVWFSPFFFESVFQAIFRVYVEEQIDTEEDDGAPVYDLIDQIPDFWQNSDVPVDHMLTM